VAGPDRLVLSPEPANLRARAPFLGALLDCLLDSGAERELLAVDVTAQHSRTLVRDRAIELVGGVGELLDAVFHELGGDGIERDAGPLKRVKRMPRSVNVLLEAVTDLAMVAEGIEGGRRHGVDGVGTD